MRPLSLVVKPVSKLSPLSIVCEVALKRLNELIESNIESQERLDLARSLRLFGYDVDNEFAHLRYWIQQNEELENIA